MDGMIVKTRRASMREGIGRVSSVVVMVGLSVGSEGGTPTEKGVDEILDVTS